MVKLLFFVHKRPDRSDAEFHEYWRTNHARLIARHAPTFGIVKYHQSHAIEDPRNDPSEAFPDRFDGVAELWFKDRAHLELWFDNSTPQTRAAGKEIREDERKFVDRSNSPFIIAEDLPVIA